MSVGWHGGTDADVERATNGRSALRIADHVVADPLDVFQRYVADCRRRRTIREYDLPGPGSPTEITKDEAGGRSRRISSRVTGAQATWFATRSNDSVVTAAFNALPVNANLAAADPRVADGLYDAACGLYNLFLDARPPGVAQGKLHKVLHIKRPGLIPILDSKLARIYREPARRQGAALGVGYAYWAAIRQDLIDPCNVQGLADCRRSFIDADDTSLLTGLSDLRLLDILAWSLDP